MELISKIESECNKSTGDKRRKELGTDFLERIEKAANHPAMKRDIVEYLEQMTSAHEMAQESRDTAQSLLKEHPFEEKLVFEYQYESGSTDKNPALELIDGLET